MYYPIGWSKHLKIDTKWGPEPNKILSIQANQERELFLILTAKSIHIWYPRPAVEIVCHRRSNDSVQNIGSNVSAVWKTDSSVIVVATDLNQLIFYQIRRRVSSTSTAAYLLFGGSAGDNSIYRLREKSKYYKNIEGSKDRANVDSFNNVPALTLFSFGKLDLTSIGISCMMSAEEELIIGSRNGDIYGIHWDGNVDEKFPWSLSKDLVEGTDFAIDLKFSSVLAGFVLVFHSGKVGFLPLKGNPGGLENGEANGVDADQKMSRLSYLPSITDASCVEINHKYRLVAVGLKSSQVILCNIGESNASLAINQKLKLDQNRYPHDISKMGSVNCLKYSPDSFAIVVCWTGGEFAIWSVFGSILFCSIQWRLESQVDLMNESSRISCLAWGREGYTLWLSAMYEQGQQTYQVIDSARDNSSGDENNSICDGMISNRTGELLVLSMARSNSTSNPNSTCCSDSIVLLSEDKIYIGPSVPQGDKFDHWFTIDILQSYLENNFPIRYTSVDRECKNVAIAGNKGFAIYQISSNKWRCFVKKSQAKRFTVCTDLIWWGDYLVTSCFNIETGLFEIRAYLTTQALDDEFSVVQTTTMEVIRMSIFENRLLVLYSDGTMGMFMLNIRMKQDFKRSKHSLSRSNSSRSSSSHGNDEKSPTSARRDSIINSNYPLPRNLLPDEFSMQISPIKNLVISNLQANPYCISSIALTRLHFKNNRLDDSILLNACGKLFLLEREMPTSSAATLPPESLASELVNVGNLSPCDLDMKANSAKRLSNSIHFASASIKNTAETSALSNITFKAVSVIATNVEQFWISPEISNATDLSYFKKSLWLYCGGSNHNLQVWLPLLNDKYDPPTNLYVPDRIMLPIKCDIYPLAIRSSAPNVLEPDDAIVLGAESDILYRDNELFKYFPYSTVKRQCRVYLHRILRELLLNQHLGYYARKVAETCQTLPYFAHCFELLLHEVLEEEATSPIPLPDPMLPQVVKFIRCKIKT